MTTFLKQAHIVNFQSIADLTLDFSESTTAITGPNDTGKSAVVKAIRAAVNNSFRPAWLRHGTASCLVELFFDDCIVRWGRKSASNYYELESPLGAASVKFSKIGRSVPPEVEAILNFGFIQIDEHRKIPLNIAGQWDAPFLVSEPGTVVSQVLGKISGIDAIYSVLKVVAAAQSDARRQVSSIDSIVSEQKENLARAEDKVSKLTGYFNAIDEIRSSLEDKNSLVTKIREAGDQISRFRGVILDINSKQADLPNDADMAVVKLTEDNIRLLIALENMYIRISNSSKTLSEIIGRLSLVPEMSAADLKFISDTIDSWHDFNSRISMLRQCREILRSCDAGLDNLSFANSDLSGFESKISDLARLTAMRKDIQAMAAVNSQLRRDSESVDSARAALALEMAEFKVCPLCNSPVMEHARV